MCPSILNLQWWNRTRITVLKSLILNKEKIGNTEQLSIHRDYQGPLVRIMKTICLRLSSLYRQSTALICLSVRNPRLCPLGRLFLV